jgi:protein-S-isoprenylcysteine O-methyltransferase Ste14
MVDAGYPYRKSRAAQLISRWMRLAIAFGGAIIFAWLRHDQPWTWMRIAGAILMVAGLGGWATAQFQLGDSFSVRPEARALVTRGIYSRIRNPIYIFSMLLLSGVALFFERPAALAFLLVLIPLQTVRARAEANVLEAKFGEEYREYRRKTWF